MGPGGIRRRLWKRSTLALLLWLTVLAFVLMAFVLPLLFRGLVGPWGQASNWAG